MTHSEAGSYRFLRLSQLEKFIRGFLMKSILQGLFGSGGEKSDRALEVLLEEGTVDLQAKTMGHQGVWNFGEEERWDFDQDVGDLVFTFSDGLVARTSAQIVGTWDSQTDTWLWAWANTTISESLARDSLLVKEYGARAGIKTLTSRKWKCSESEAWGMAGVATKLCDAQGAYKGPAGDTFVFFTFGEVSLSREDVSE